MKYLCFIVGVLFGLFSLMLFSVAKTSIHEIQAAVLLLVAAVLVCSGAVINSVDRLRKVVESRTP